MFRAANAAFIPLVVCLVKLWVEGHSTHPFQYHGFYQEELRIVALGISAAVRNRRSEHEPQATQEQRSRLRHVRQMDLSAANLHTRYPVIVTYVHIVGGI